MTNFYNTMWRDRLLGTQHSTQVWEQLLAVRLLAVPPKEDRETWVMFSDLCRPNPNLMRTLTLSNPNPDWTKNHGSCSPR